MDAIVERVLTGTLGAFWLIERTLSFWPLG